MLGIHRVLAILLLGVLVEICGGTGELSLKLVYFKNPSHRVYNGGCCDTNLICGLDQCDNYFKVCLTSLGSLQRCDLAQFKTDTLGDDDFTFGNTLKSGVANPVIFSFTEWKGGLTTDIQSWDDDSGQPGSPVDDLVGQYNLITQRGAGRSASRPSKARATLSSDSGNSQLRIEIYFYCHANYFVPDCTEYCVDQDNDTGHFTCDYILGKKVCMIGWWGPECNREIKVCIPQNSTEGHYDCDPISGNKICLPGWYGPSLNCTSEIPLPSSSSIFLPSSSWFGETSTMVQVLLTSSSSLLIQPSTSVHLAMTSSVLPSTVTLPSILSTLSSLPVLSTSTTALSRHTVTSTSTAQYTPHSSSVTSEPTGVPPISEEADAVIVDMEPDETNEKWSEDKEEKMKEVVAEKINDYCSQNTVKCFSEDSNNSMIVKPQDVKIIKEPGTDKVKIKIQVVHHYGNSTETLPSDILQEVIESSSSEIEQVIQYKITKVQQMKAVELTDAPIFSSNAASPVVFILGGVILVLVLLATTFGAKAFIDRRHRVRKVHFITDDRDSPLHHGDLMNLLPRKSSPTLHGFTNYAYGRRSIGTISTSLSFESDGHSAVSSKKTLSILGSSSDFSPSSPFIPQRKFTSVPEIQDI